MTAPNSTNAIEVEHLSKAYGTTAAVQDLVFTVEPGEIVGFLGPNGAGKTTTMRILAGYLPATSGTARIAGFDVHTQSMEVRKRIGYLPELPPLYPGMTVSQYLHFVARIKGVRRSDRAASVQRATEQCGLEEKAKTRINKLSKGYRQRVGLAQAIVHDPPVIILDEPTVGLDPRQIIEVRNLIKGLAGERTILLSTHILPEASMICDRVTIINQGQVIATDTPENLMSQMVGGTNYTVEVSDWRDTLRTELVNLPTVQQLEVETDDGTAARRHLLQIACLPESEPGSAIARTLVEAGVAIHEMQRSRPSLEDVFLELITQEETLDESELSASDIPTDHSEQDEGEQKVVVEVGAPVTVTASPPTSAAGLEATPSTSESRDIEAGELVTEATDTTQSMAKTKES